MDAGVVAGLIKAKQAVAMMVVEIFTAAAFAEQKESWAS